MNNTLGTAVVTGASAGIGKVYAERLAARGYDLILVARRENLLLTHATNLRNRYGCAVQTLTADLSQSNDLDRITTVLESDHNISMLINNAGTSTLGSSVDIRSSLRKEMIDVNIVALTELALAVVPGFMQRDAGTLVNIGSVLGFHSLPISSIYSGTKGYVLNLTRGLQDELAAAHVYVQLVLPAATATDLWEISGVPLSALDPQHVMTVERCVDAALAGMDRRELITMPSVEDESLFNAYDATRVSLFGASQSGTPASRYSVDA